MACSESSHSQTWNSQTAAVQDTYVFAHDFKTSESNMMKSLQKVEKL